MALTRINLSGGSYDARAVSVAAQRVLNLYAEPIPAGYGEPIQFAYYLTPGLKAFAQMTGPVEALYQATNGDLIAVAGGVVAYIPDGGGGFIELGTITSGSGPARMCDNGTALFVVNGGKGGWYCTMPGQQSAFSYTVNSAVAEGSTALVIESAFQLVSGYTYKVSGTGIASGTTITAASPADSITTSGAADSGTTTITIQSSFSLSNGVTYSISGAGIASGTTIIGTAANSDDSSYTDLTLSTATTAAIDENTILSVAQSDGQASSTDITTLTLSAATTADIDAAAAISVTTVSSSRYGPLVSFVDDAFYGSPVIDILDTFFLFTNPDTSNWYTSPAQFADENQTPFDALYVASDSTSLSTIKGLAVLGQYIWLFGRWQTELWYDSGAGDFPFQRLSGVTIEAGCISPYTIAKLPSTQEFQNGAIMWLAQDRAGYARVYLGALQSASPVSTFPVEGSLQDMGDLSRAVASVYQQEGHIFYVLTVPGHASSWVYDASTSLWHERCSLDASGNESQYRPFCWASAYGKVFAGDYENGTIYEVDLNTFTDGEIPIKRQRAFPHLLTNGTRGIHRCLTLDMQNGASQSIDVDWSDDRGATFNAPQALTLGASGNVWPTLWRLGMARDRVYRLTWTDPGDTALMGAFIDLEPVRS